MRFQEMIGLPVFDIEQGKKVGKVLDILLNEDWSITGIQLEERYKFNPGVKVVIWNDIVAYGTDAVMIRNQQAITKWKAENIQYTFLSGNGKLKELPVLTEAGTKLGHVSDVYFNQDMGNTITGIEISDGFFSDLIEGRKTLPFASDMLKGEHVIMVPPNSEQRWRKLLILSMNR